MISPIIESSIILVLIVLNAYIWHRVGAKNPSSARCRTSYNQYIPQLNISGHVFKMNNNAGIGECVNCGLVITTDDIGWKEHIFANDFNTSTGDFNE